MISHAARISFREHFQIILAGAGTLKKLYSFLMGNNIFSGRNAMLFSKHEECWTGFLGIMNSKPVGGSAKTCHI